MKNKLASISILFSLLGALPFAAHAQPISEPTSEFYNIVGAPISFGTVPVGSSAQTVIGGTNNTAFVLNVYAALGGPDAGDFSITNACSGIPLIQGASCSGIVKFTPRSAGPKQAELIVVMRGVQPVVPEVCTVGSVPVPAIGCDTTRSATTNMEPTSQFLYTQMHALSGVGQ